MAIALNWTTIVSAAISALFVRIGTGAGIVIANRYTVRLLDKIERNGKNGSKVDVKRST